MERNVEIKQGPEPVEGLASRFTYARMPNENNSPLKQIIEFQIQRDTDELLRDGWTMQEINKLRSKIRS